jgi:Cytochrome c554 and c-prime
MENPNTSEKQIKRIVLNRMERCTVCHHTFAPEDIHVLSRKADMWMMVVQCTECHARNFVAAVLGDGDPDEAQLALRRLSQGYAEADEEVEGAAVEAAGPPVSVDDVVDMHEYLRDFDGDFERLFRGR